MVRNVVLTGFMGTGKSTVGRTVARRLGHRFVDTDHLIEQRHGPIPQIFATRGEAAFRDLEHEIACEVARDAGLVVATGGRLMLDPHNVAPLCETGRPVCLTASVDTILARVTADGVAARPLLAGDDPRTRIEELLGARAGAYACFAQVRTDGRTAEEIADEVIVLVSAEPSEHTRDGVVVRSGTGILPLVRRPGEPLVVVAGPEVHPLVIASLGPAVAVVQPDDAATIDAVASGIDACTVAVVGSAVGRCPPLRHRLVACPTDTATLREARAAARDGLIAEIVVDTVLVPFPPGSDTG